MAVEGLKERAADVGRRLPVLAERTLGRFFSHRDTQTAAAISYYALLSIFPIAIVMAAVFGLVVEDEAARTEVIDFLLREIPLEQEAGRRDLEDLLTGVTRNAGTLSVVGAVGLVFTASGLMGAIRHGLNGAWEVEDRRPPLRGKALDVLFVLGVGVLIVVSAGFTLVGRVALSLGDELEQVLGPVGSATPRLLLELGPLTSLLFGFATFAFLYRFVPANGVRFRDVWVAALAAAGGYELAKLGFSLYLDSFGNYNAVYGSIGAVVAFAVFVFLGANVFLLGAEASAEWRGLRHERLEPGPPLREKVLGALSRLVFRDGKGRGGGSGPGTGRRRRRARA